MSDPLTYPDGTPFPGVVGDTMAASTPAWPVGPRPAPGSPNIVMILLDDVGFAQLGCFGSDIATPNIDQLAANGLRYRQYHTTAMCSPTRAAVLTGRNHHTCGMGGIADLAMGFPGFHARIPKSCGFVSEVLRQAGYATYAVGKWHLAPADETHAGAPRDRWPLGQGFERFYGFLGAETNQFAPDLCIDNSLQPALERRTGYHLSADLVDRAIGMIDDLRVGEPTKPFFCYLAFGACHSPHQAPAAYIDAYRGRFDEGWDVWRERTHRRQLELGIIPPGTALSPRPPWVPAWESLSERERIVHARMMEVYAGFLTHTDAQIGRLVEALARNGELDRTLILLSSDNGASAEGGPFGTFNENFLFNGLPHDLEATYAKLDDLGGPDSHGHYPWGWALAGNTPYQRWKRETHEGGIGDPLVVHWPERTSAADRGAIRDQYVHAIDLGATVLDAAGLSMPEVLNGVPQEPLAGVSILPSVADPSVPGRRTQYYEQFACRAIYHDGWKAVTHHPMFKYLPTDDPDAPFDEDRWELYHVAVDPSETHDLAATEPERLAELQSLWWEEARRYGALPLVARRQIAGLRPPGRIDQRLELRPGAAPLPEANMPRLHRRPVRMVCDVTLAAVDEGVLIAHGGRFGGISWYVLDGSVCYTYNYLGLEATTVSAPVPPGRHLLALEQDPIDDGPSARLRLSVDGTVVAEAIAPRTVPVRFTLAGEGICCGFDDGTPAAPEYEGRGEFRFTGTIHRAFIDVSGAPVVDLAGEVRAAWQVQ
jgi:arylsulfatase